MTNMSSLITLLEDVLQQASIPSRMILHVLHPAFAESMSCHHSQEYPFASTLESTSASVRIFVCKVSEENGASLHESELQLLCSDWQTQGIRGALNREIVPC